MSLDNGGEDAAFSSLRKSGERNEHDEVVGNGKGVSSYQNPKSFYKDIKSERNALFSSKGKL